MLHVVLPVHNRRAITECFVHSLQAQQGVEWRLLLVDDGCTDGTVDAVRALLSTERLLVLHGDGQLWWAGALQLAWRALTALPMAEGDAVLLINDDVRFEPDFLAQGMAVLAEHRDACIQASAFDPAVGEVDRGTVADLRRLNFRSARADEAPNCLSTRGLLMGADTFRNGGGFRPRRLPHYLSDYEFTLRLQRQGTRLMVDDRFYLEMDLSSTGLDLPTARSVRELWRQALSNRAKFNPLQWSAFTIMACPVSVVPGHLARIWLRFARNLFRAATSHDRVVS